MKDPKRARIIMVAVIALSILFGGYRSLSAEVAAVEKIFFNGVDGDGIGVNSDLSHRIDISYNLVTVAKRYLSANDSTITSVIDTASRIENSKNPSDKLRANKELQLDFISLSEKLEGYELSEKDSEYRDNLIIDFYSRNHIISLDGYNQEAVEFNTKLNRFPASLLGSITGIKPFELSQ